MTCYYMCYNEILKTKYVGTKQKCLHIKQSCSTNAAVVLQVCRKNLRLQRLPL